MNNRIELVCPRLHLLLATGDRDITRGDVESAIRWLVEVSADMPALEAPQPKRQVAACEAHDVLACVVCMTDEFSAADYVGGGR